MTTLALKVSQLFTRNSTIVVQVTNSPDVIQVINNAHGDLLTRLDFHQDRSLTVKYREMLGEAHEGFVNNLDVISQYNHRILVPFPGVGSKQLFTKPPFAISFLDAITFLKISECDVEFHLTHPNCKIDSNDGYGVYYIDGPQRSLKFNFTQLLHSLKFSSDEMKLPNLVFILILNSTGDYLLPPNESKKVVTDIFSTEEFLKPMQSVQIQCINPTCALLENADDLAAAVALIKGYICR